MTPVGSGSAKRQRERKKKSHPLKLSVDFKEFLEKTDVTDQKIAMRHCCMLKCIAFMSMLKHIFQYNGKKHTKEHFFMHALNLQFEVFSFFADFFFLPQLHQTCDS